MLAIEEAAGAALSPSKSRTDPASPQRSVCAPTVEIHSLVRRPEAWEVPKISWKARCRGEG